MRRTAVKTSFVIGPALTMKRQYDDGSVSGRMTYAYCVGKGRWGRGVEIEIEIERSRATGVVSRDRVEGELTSSERNTHHDLRRGEDEEQRVAVIPRCRVEQGKATLEQGRVQALNAANHEVEAKRAPPLRVLEKENRQGPDGTSDKGVDAVVAATKFAHQALDEAKRAYPMRRGAVRCGAVQ